MRTRTRKLKRAENLEKLFAMHNRERRVPQICPNRSRWNGLREQFAILRSEMIRRRIVLLRRFRSECRGRHHRGHSRDGDVHNLKHNSEGVPSADPACIISTSNNRRPSSGWGVFRACQELQLRFGVWYFESSLKCGSLMRCADVCRQRHARPFALTLLLAIALWAAHSRGANRRQTGCCPVYDRDLRCAGCAVPPDPGISCPARAISFMSPFTTRPT